MSSATAPTAPTLLMAQTILSETTVRRSAVDRDNLKPYCKSEKNPQDNYKFFKDFTYHRKKINRAVVFSCRPFPNILKYRDHHSDLSTIWKTMFL